VGQSLARTSPSHELDSATGEEMVAAMNNVGVDGAISHAAAASPTSIVVNRRQHSGSSFGAD
jgi:hypothetical protein